MHHSFGPYHILFAVADAANVHNGPVTRNRLAKIFCGRLSDLDKTGNRRRAPVVNLAVDTVRRFKAGEYPEEKP